MGRAIRCPPPAPLAPDNAVLDSARTAPPPVVVPALRTSNCRLAAGAPPGLMPVLALLGCRGGMHGAAAGDCCRVGNGAAAAALAGAIEYARRFSAGTGAPLWATPC